MIAQTIGMTNARRFRINVEFITCLVAMCLDGSQIQGLVRIPY